MSSLSFSAGLARFVGAFPCVGFSGSRRGGSAPVAACQSFLAACPPATSVAVGVGCARGVDSTVRAAVPAAQVFRVQQPASRAAFAQRSTRLVQWVAARQGLLVVFPLGSAPGRLQPGQQFAGFGSGSWGAAALAIGLGTAVLVVVPAGPFPAPPAVARHFVPVGPAPGGCGQQWLAQPAQQQCPPAATGQQLALIAA